MTENNETPKKWWKKYWKAIPLMLLVLMFVRGYQWWNKPEEVTSKEVIKTSSEVVAITTVEKEEKSPRKSSISSPEKQVVIIRNNCDGVLFYEREVPLPGMLMVYQGVHDGKHVFTSGPIKIPGFNKKKNNIQNCLEVKNSRDDGSFYERRDIQSRAFEYLLRGHESFHKDSEYGVCNGLQFINQ